MAGVGGLAVWPAGAFVVFGLRHGRGTHARHGGLPSVFGLPGGRPVMAGRGWPGTAVRVSVVVFRLRHGRRAHVRHGCRASGTLCW